MTKIIITGTERFVFLTKLTNINDSTVILEHCREVSPRCSWKLSKYGKSWLIPHGSFLVAAQPEDLVQRTRSFYSPKDQVVDRPRFLAHMILILHLCTARPLMWVSEQQNLRKCNQLLSQQTSSQPGWLAPPGQLSGQNDSLTEVPMFAVRDPSSFVPSVSGLMDPLFHPCRPRALVPSFLN